MGRTARLHKRVEKIRGSLLEKKWEKKIRNRKG